MNQLQKYTWLIETIRRAGKISHKELSDRWQRNKDLSDEKPLHRATFSRWKDAIFSQFGIIISCQKVGGYLYYIENPEEIDDDKLKKWMLDSFAVGNIISENLSLKGRIVVDEIPSGRLFLTTMLEAVKENRTVVITYRPFTSQESFTFPIKPYCIRLFENRWYVVGLNNRNEIRVYGLDRMESVELTSETFKLPADFSAEDLFSTRYGIVIGFDIKPETIILRAHGEHRHYLRSLPLHSSQRLINQTDDYADFELYLSPTYDFILKLLHQADMIEVIKPASLRQTMKEWIVRMLSRYE